jgi:hypothetical protein
MTIEDLDMTYENEYAIYSMPDTKVVVFKYHVPTLESFKMTQEEKTLGLKLCLEARLNGNWTGDILRGPYANN